MSAVRVSVPASSANLGPGFDTLGLALDLRDVIEAEVTGNGLRVEVVDAGAGGTDAVPTGETHLVVRALRRACTELGFAPPGLRLRCHNAIPHARGLGSSAAAAVAGVVAGYTLAGKDLDENTLRLAAEFDGHADNAAASLLGGLTIAWRDERGFLGVRLPVHESVRPLVAVPEHRASTEQARGVLPEAVPHEVAAFNVGRSALLVHALTSAPELLLDATEDRLHQPYRERVLPDSVRLVRELRAHGVPATISGAGPSVLILTTDGQVPAAADVTGFTLRDLPVAAEGVRIEP